ncbi:hypothetical protein [Paraurantiacibacter namhicola]|uniref:Uncharacterized protein n=1 Tax=Paraurantiacibacter namhicola TaxID=645517 RepID=A0A1C7D9C3_9SPHN|nr:hypothetical protein [Paraurantiacibacter namhicola]ANU08080.1 hypothetical protein A6F65_01785 [Paraurantiacibacter namhicola]
MNDTAVLPVEETMRHELALGDAVIASCGPILQHLLANDENGLFGDEVIARVRGMMTRIARDMLFAQADAAGVPDAGHFAQKRQEPLLHALLCEVPLLSHAQSLVVEAQVASRLQKRSNIDGVLSPLLQELVASSDPAMASAAMGVLSAQARFSQGVERMALPIAELPGDLLHRALLVMRNVAEDEGEPEEPVEKAERALRDAYDESASRLGQISRLLSRMGDKAVKALDIDHAGVAIFASALAMASGQQRDLAVLSFTDRQFARLALALRASGLNPRDVEEQFLYLHPQITMPDGFDTMSADRAASLLAEEPEPDFG